MNSVFQEIIGESNFEKTIVAISSILDFEITNQKNLDENFTEDVNFYLERSTPLNEGEEIVINVFLESIEPTSKTQLTVQNDVNINIDIYVVSVEKQGLSGDVNSSTKLNKIIKLIMLILLNNEYKTLGFEPGFIGKTNIEKIKSLEPSLRGEANFARLSRISFSCSIVEQLKPSEVENVNIFLTNAKIDLTDSGYKIKYESN